ncbi:MAG TPA: NADH-quinone oxidoreductase subunit NuoF [Firmicutes bacterium]|nr:NADH-quinone oxidoreductase subunit NuoF [Bacillota bacterium]
MFYRAHVLVCNGTNCSLKASSELQKEFSRLLAEYGLEQEVKVVETGCFGLCEYGPTVVVFPEGTFYAGVKVADVREIVSEHLYKGRVVKRLLYQVPPTPKPVQTYPEVDYFKNQVRVVLRNCGLIDPESIEEYVAQGGYQAVGKALTSMTPAQVIEEIKASGLRGRGGAGFPTGLKWQFAARADGSGPKYVVCNADEGEPGTFKDRLILEGDPHSVLEGMLIAGYAAGANQGYVYIRGEYTLSIERLQKAIAQAREMGLLGRNILGSGFDFDVEIRLGAGAYVCGEETALFESLEGGRGEPRIKPPYPTDAGLFGRPTVINNVETLANVPVIMERGASWFRTLGTQKTPGTKVFTLTGDIVNAGLIEVPMGITLREILYNIGGGIPDGRRFKLAQTGGTSGGVIPPELLDVPMDYDTLAAHGSALGSGALLVIDDRHCVVDVAKSFSFFFLHESCGKCTPCREGTLQLQRIMERIADGRATMADVENMKTLAQAMYVAPLCPLGQTAPLPLMSTFKWFESEYLAHVVGKTCPAGVCPVGNGTLAAPAREV